MVLHIIINPHTVWMHGWLIPARQNQSLDQSSLILQLTEDIFYAWELSGTDGVARQILAAHDKSERVKSEGQVFFGVIWTDCCAAFDVVDACCLHAFLKLANLCENSEREN